MTSALITGGNRGLGRRTAEVLAARGWLVLVGHRREHAADEVVSGLRERGWRAEGVLLDVTDPASVASAEQSVAARTAGLHAVVNNAGVYPADDGGLDGVTAQVCSSTLATNCVGPLLVVQAFRSLLRASGSGRVVNVSSAEARADRADGTHSAYRMSKAALDVLTANLAVALHRDDILVNSVDPGWIPTDMGGPDAPDDLDTAAELVAWAASAVRRTGAVLTARDLPTRSARP
ncbi:SDR family NAD(P)-dependent oxidoreductase [Actinosynnema sp. NPDC050436]|uniref:SDR family NAD(P)-dependent oxidoreductase n=1 Tax=Actinosynnema sp. NPDC050436 TaxID=3155659 RepID=UPI0033E0550B